MNNHGVLCLMMNHAGGCRWCEECSCAETGEAEIEDWSTWGGKDDKKIDWNASGGGKKSAGKED